MKSDDRIVQCPFYHSCTPLNIRCDGFSPDIDLTLLRFKAEENRLTYMKTFCYTNCWKGCVLAQEIEFISSFTK